MKYVSFKKGIELLGYNIVKYNKGYNFRSCFATDKDNNMYYFSIEDLRDEDPKIMYRTARDTHDYTGGYNTWDFDTRLSELGYAVKESRQKCDYNSN